MTAAPPLAAMFRAPYRFAVVAVRLIASKKATSASAQGNARVSNRAWIAIKHCLGFPAAQRQIQVRTAVTPDRVARKVVNAVRRNAGKTIRVGTSLVTTVARIPVNFAEPIPIAARAIVHHPVCAPTSRTTALRSAAPANLVLTAAI